MQRRDKMIGERQYSLLLPPVIQSISICNRTAVLLGPVLGSIGKLADSANLATFSQVLNKVDPLKLDSIFMDCVRACKLSVNSQTICDENLLEFNKHFNDKRGEVYPVLTWMLWECVKDFFPGLGDFTQKIMDMATISQQSQSPKDGK